MRLSLRLDSKARGERILYCIRLTSNAASEDAAASEWQVYFDRGPKARVNPDMVTDNEAHQYHPVLHQHWAVQVEQICSGAR